MSHLMTATTIIRDPAALARACDLLGWRLLERVSPRLYAEEGPLCDYVVQPTETQRSIGFQVQADGTYTVVCDSMDRHRVERLTQEYNYAVLEAAAALEGALLTRGEVLADGTVTLWLEVQ